MTSKKPFRVGVYLRVSTSEQSTELQRSEIDQYLTVRDSWIENAVYYDDSGCTGTNTNRPKFKELMADARQRKIDAVIVWKLDRFGRSLKDLIVHMDELNQLGVAFISLKDQLDLTTAAGRLMAHVLGAFAAFEADIIRERTRAGIRVARERANGRWGRRKSIDEEAIRALKAGGASIREIAERLGVAKSSVQLALGRITPHKVAG